MNTRDAAATAIVALVRQLLDAPEQAQFITVDRTLTGTAAVHASLRAALRLYDAAAPAHAELAPIQPIGPVWRCNACDYWASLSDNMIAHTAANPGHVGQADKGAEGTKPRTALGVAVDVDAARTHEEAATLFPHVLYFPWNGTTKGYGQPFADAKVHGQRLGLYHVAGQNDAVLRRSMDDEPDGCIVGGKAGEPPPTRFPMLRDVTLYWRDRAAAKE